MFEYVIIWLLWLTVIDPVTHERFHAVIPIEVRTADGCDSERIRITNELSELRPNDPSDQSFFMECLPVAHRRTTS